MFIEFIYWVCFAESLFCFVFVCFFFQFFLKATQLEQMSSDYQLIIEQQDIIKNTLDRKQEVCNTNVKKLLAPFFCGFLCHLFCFL